MNRRGFVGSMLGAAALAGSGEAMAAESAAGRPALSITPEGADRWQVRSWELREGAWRPHVAALVRDRQAFRVEGKVAAQDRTALRDWIQRHSA